MRKNWNFDIEDTKSENVAKALALKWHAKQPEHVKPRWIPVSKYLPENDTFVLAAISVNDMTEYMVMWRVKDTWQCRDGLRGEVKAWIPIEPYRGE